MTSFQDRSAAWMDVAFANDPTDGSERRDRAAEEDCEAYQADGGTLEDWIAIGRYTFGRPAGALPKEFGQKVFTLACWAAYRGIDMMAEAERELARCSTPEFIEKLARKRATRHGRGPLPGFSGPETSDPGVAPASSATPDGVIKERGEDGRQGASPSGSGSRASIKPADAVSPASGGIDPSRGFPNYAGRRDVDGACAAELSFAGIEVGSYEFCREQGEVKTAIAGFLHGWSFKRAWCYWVATGPGIELSAAEALHAAHGSAVRVEGHCGCPSPREWNQGLATGHYHVDTLAGLKALADTIRGLVERAKASAPGIETGGEDAKRLSAKHESPVGKAEAPASTVQPPSSQESGAGETEGWVLVPREPMPEMIAAFWRIKNTGTLEIGEFGEDRSDCAAYRAMISCAPRPSQREG